MKIKKMLLLLSLFVFFFVIPAVRADFISDVFYFGRAAYLTITIGICTTIAFAIVIIIRWRYQINRGPWVLISFVSFFLTLSEIMKFFVDDVNFHQFFFTAAMAMFFMVAVLKYWENVRITE